MAKLKEKTCTSCRQVRPRAWFHENGRPNGRSHCKTCANAKRAAQRRKQKAETPRLTAEAKKERERLRCRRRRVIKKLRAGTYKADGPCWCCRNQAIGDTPYRLCVICGG